MRLFSDFEKEIARNLVSGDTLSKIFNRLIKDFTIAVDKDSRKIELIVEHSDELAKDNNKKFIDNAIKQSQVIINVINLLSYLENQGLIYSHNLKSVSYPKIFLGNLEIGEKLSSGSNNKFISFNFPDNNVIDLLIHYSDYTIFITDEFKYLIKKGFRSRELNLSRINIIIACGALLLTAGVGFGSLWLTNKSLNMPVESMQPTNPIFSGSFRLTTFEKKH